MVLCGVNGVEGKCQHASFLFNEMRKFQKVGILCDVRVPGQLHVVEAHKVVLMSANPHTEDKSLPQEEDKSCNFPMEEVLKAYAPSDEGRPMEVSQPDEASDSLKERLGVLNDLRLHHCCCDVTLVANGLHCDVHKVVLAACSDYFKAMFTSKMRESVENTVQIHDIDEVYVRMIVDFMYTGEVALEFDVAVDLLRIAVYYQILPLINRCQTFLISNLSPHNCCYLARLSRDLALQDFASHCRDHVIRHFLELDCDESEVELLSVDDVISSVRRDDLGNGNSNSSTEQTILKIVLRWLLCNIHEIDELKQEELISEIRFALISKVDLEICCRQLLVDNNNNNNNNMPSRNKVDFSDVFGEVFQKYYDNAISYHDRLYEQPLLGLAKHSLRTDHFHWACVDGVLAPKPVRLPTGSKNVFVGVQDADPDEDGSVPIRDPYHNVVEFNGFLYVLGAVRRLDSCYSRTVTRYDPRLDTKLRVADMNEERGDFVACVIDDVIYVIGGRNRRGALRSCEKYDPRKNVWERVADLPQGIYMAAGLPHDGSIYVTGGFNDYETTGCTLRYVVSDDRWEELFAPMMCDRGFHALLEGHDGKMWAVGGVDNPFSGRNVWEVEEFDPEAQMWSFVGQVLPVQPFLSMMRINAFLHHDRRLCIFSVTSPHKTPMLEHVPDKRMWFEMKSRVSVSQVRVD